MGTTARGIQYPDGTDAVGDVRDDIQSVADTTDTAINDVANAVTAIAYFRGSTTTQSVATGAATVAVPLTTGGPGALNEDGSHWSYDGTNRVMVAAAACLVMVTGYVGWDAFPSGQWSDLRLYRVDTDGTTLLETHWVDEKLMVAGDRNHGLPACIVYLNAGEGVQMRVRHSDTGTVSLREAQMRLATLRID